MEKPEISNVINMIIPEVNGVFLETLILEYALEEFTHIVKMKDLGYGEWRLVDDVYQHVIDKFNCIKNRHNGHFCTSLDRNMYEFNKALCEKERFGIFRNEDTLFITYSTLYEAEDRMERSEQIRLLLRNLSSNWKPTKGHILTNQNRLEVKEYSYHLSDKGQIMPLWLEEDHDRQYFKVSIIGCIKLTPPHPQKSFPATS